jgi:hypothetical protein
MLMQKMKWISHLAVALPFIGLIADLNGQDALFSEHCWSKLNYFRILTDSKADSKAHAEEPSDRIRSFESLAVLVSILATSDSDCNEELLIETTLGSKPNAQSSEQFGTEVTD